MEDFPEYQMDSDVLHGPDKRTIIETLVCGGKGSFVPFHVLEN